MDAKERFIREKEVKTITGLSQSTRWRLEKEGNFPKKHRISKGAVAWRLSEVQAWIEERSRAA